MKLLVKTVRDNLAKLANLLVNIVVNLLAKKTANVLVKKVVNLLAKKTAKTVKAIFAYLNAK